MGIEAAADGRSAQSQFGKPRLNSPDPIHAQLYLPGIARKFLTQRHGHGILQVRTPELSHILEFRGFSVKAIMKTPKGRDQAVVEALQRCNMNHRRDHVIAGLPQIDMVIGVHR